jgi:CyaY protein
MGLRHPEIVMTDLEFMDLAEQLLQAVERNCDAINDNTDADIDNQRVGGMVTLSFADGSQIVVNLQKPLHEVWLAAKSGGFHYRNIDGRWRDTKTGREFFDDLSRCSAEQSKLPLRFSA